MIRIEGGAVRVGSDRHYPEERPARVKHIAPFLIDATQVTVGAFTRFVAQTGWRTAAEQAGASMVFVPTAGPVHLGDPSQWWRLTPGADWRHPFGPAAPAALDTHPVVHVAQQDALAFCAWRGARLPTEWEWEAAARGGLDGAAYCWGDSFSPDGALLANVWTGMFPYYFARGTPGPLPVGRFPPNGFGLFDMAGNVWERTSSFFVGDTCCAPVPRGADDLVALRGGSFLCAAEYCLRYRPAARIGVPETETTCHIGLRCAADAPGLDRVAELA